MGRNVFGWREIFITVLAAMLFVAATSSARAQSVGMSVRAGTLGPGIELTLPLARTINARIGGHYITYSRSDIIRDYEVDVRYDADLRLATAEALLDWHPLGNALRLTVGGMLNRNGIDAVMVPVESYTIDEKTFSPERIGNLTGSVRQKATISPYAGIGIGNASVHRFGFALDLGTMYTSTPVVTMEGTGMIAPTADQAADLEASLKSFEWYPVVSLGFSIGL